MASKRIRALEMAPTPEQTQRALKKIVATTDTNVDTIFGIQYRNDVVHAGGLKAIMRAMREHPEIADIQDFSCQALSNLAFENDKMRVVVAQLCGITAILNAMKNHRNEEQLQWHALQALWRLTLNDWVRDSLLKKGTPDVIREIMAAHPSSKEYVQFWGDLTLKHLEEPPSQIYLEESRDLPDWLIDLFIGIFLLFFFRSLY